MQMTTRLLTMMVTLAVLMTAGVLGAAASSDDWIELPLRNPSFEEPLVNGTPPGWKRGWSWEVGTSFQGHGYLGVSTDVASDGKQSFVMDGTSADGTEKVIVSEPLAAVAGAEYRLSVNVYADPAKAPHPYILVAFWGENGKRIHYKSIRTSGLAGEWERVTVTETAPEGTAQVYVALVGNTTYTGVTYWDEVTLEVMYPEGVNPPAETTGESIDTSMWAEPELVSEVLLGKRTEADVTWWGFDPEDSTKYMQAAIDSGVSRLVIPNVGQDWIVRPIFLRSNLELILEDGVVVMAKKGEFQGRNDSLFTARDVENLKIHGYGATLRMHKEDYDNPDLYEKAEWRMGINLRGVTNVEILGLTVTETGGDGIYLGRGSKTYNENVTIRDFIADNNYRQGISVISAKDLLIEDSVFRDTSGTAPMAGIDLEPNRPDERLENIVIRNSVFENNHGPGLHMYLAFMDSTSVPISVLWENVIVRGSTVGVNISYGNSDDFPEGEIVVRNCVVEGSERNGINIRNKSDGGALQIKIEDCIFWDVATNALVNMDNLQSSVPIYMSAENSLRGVTLHNVTVADAKARPVLAAELRNADEADEESGFFIDGNLRVLNPYGTELVWNGPMREVSLDVEDIETLRIDYSRAAIHPEYDWDPVIVELEPVIRFINPSHMRPYTEVQGTLVPEVELLHFGDDDLETVEVLLNGERVYSGSKGFSPGEIEIDTTVFHDGNQELTVIATGKKSGRVEQSTLFFTKNFELVFDRFEGPRQVAWFGEVYSPVVIDQSSGWEYLTGQPEVFFGDIHRKQRKENTTEYLVWETPQLYSFTFDVYAEKASIQDVLVIEGSTDQTTWSPIPFTVESADASGAGWQKFVLQSDLDTPGSDRYVRLTLKETDTFYRIQLGEAVFRLLR